MSFYKELEKNLIKESGNYYSNNYDFLSHGKKSFRKKISNLIKLIIFHPAIVRYLISNKFIFNNLILTKVVGIQPFMSGISSMYDKLEDQFSKELLIKIVSFRIMGYNKVKLPFHTDNYWSELELLKSHRDENSIVKLSDKPWSLYLHDLNYIGINIKLYYTTIGTYSSIVRDHYKYTGNNTVIEVEEGDFVLDLGGCYGDTALYFSDKIGPKGKIYSFEFIPGSIDLFNKNLSFNPTLKSNIEIINKPLWNSSGKKVYYQDKGGASKVKFEPFNGYEGTTETTTIDQFVKEQNLSRVDFIKTDIEGAEPFVLEGAVDTITKFKPKLAISIYHNYNDFTGIINQIDSLNLGYKFYIGHASIYASETVLFCKV